MSPSIAAVGCPDAAEGAMVGSREKFASAIASTRRVSLLGYASLDPPILCALDLPLSVLEVREGKYESRVMQRAAFDGGYGPGEVIEQLSPGVVVVVGGS